MDVFVFWFLPATLMFAMFLDILSDINPDFFRPQFNPWRWLYDKLTQIEKSVISHKKSVSQKDDWEWYNPLDIAKEAIEFHRRLYNGCPTEIWIGFGDYEILCASNFFGPPLPKHPIFTREELLALAQFERSLNIAVHGHSTMEKLKLLEESIVEPLPQQTFLGLPLFVHDGRYGIYVS